MGKHKLVPVEPTQEMIDAGCKKHTCNYGDFCLESEIEDQDVKSIYVAMLAAAPEVEQPAAAWARMKGGEVANAFADRALAEFVAGFAANKLEPLYLHPQPAPDVQGEPVATIHVDGSFVHVAWRIPAPSRCAMDVYTAPQPAHDAALLEAFDAGRRAAQAEAAELDGALDEMIKEADLASWGGYFPATAVARAVEALAAYRKAEQEQAQ